jgi:ribose-phosphate pyrophosphokinase
MTSEIQIQHLTGRYETKSFTFPGGELQVHIPDLPERLARDLTVVARLQSSDAILRLTLATEILGRAHRAGHKRFVVPYFPYARQDRVMQPGEAFSLKAVARIINGLSYDEVVVCDPHSDVTPALVESVRVISQAELVAQHADLRAIVESSSPAIVAPDAGAAKKAFAVAQHFGLPLLTASKVRDVATGAITRTELHAAEPLPGRDSLIVDDICDGGRTFVELAKALKAHGAGRVFLYVTHGIFSQGLGVFDGLLDGVFTTDSFRSERAYSTLKVPLHVHNLTF